MKNQESNSNHCISHAPGHNVHWIQARVKYSEPRYDAAVEILSETTLQIRYLEKTEVFHHHNTLAIKGSLAAAVMGYVKFAPTASILYIQTEQPGDNHKGAFSLHYLAEGHFTECVFS